MTSFQKIVLRTLMHLLDESRNMSHSLKMSLLRELMAAERDLEREDREKKSKEMEEVIKEGKKP